MKLVKLSLILIAVVAAIVGFGTTSYAFHDGGVADCGGCHDLHDGQSQSALLIAVDITSTCANASCHGSPTAGSYHILTPSGSLTAGNPPLQNTPGGDFGWLLKSYTWSPRSGSSATSLAERHGHNVVAAGLTGYTARDPENATPPGGGTMDASLLACNSCHDNHGKLRRLSNGTFATTGAPIIASGSYTNSADPIAGQAVGSYRLLRGPGSTAGSGGMTFTTVFNAVVASTYNRSETFGPTAMAYGRGISDWCATCHPQMLTATSSMHTHPTNQQFSATEAANYNAYLGSGLTGNSGFDTIVPYQDDNSTDYAALRAAANTANYAARDSSTSSRIMCLSCHRAHATGWDHMTRWNNEYEFIAADGMWPGTNATGATASTAGYAQGRTTQETASAYNFKLETSYATFQRSLCNKCHAKD